MKVIAITAILSLVIGFGAGFLVNNWRHAQVRADLSVCQGNTATLTNKLAKQNASVSAFEQESRDRVKSSEKALEEAQGELNDLAQKNEWLRKQAGASCAEAEQLIDEALGL